VNAFRYRISCGFLAAVARCLNSLPSSLSTIVALDILIAIFCQRCSCTHSWLRPPSASTGSVSADFLCNSLHIFSFVSLAVDTCDITIALFNSFHQLVSTVVLSQCRFQPWSSWMDWYFCGTIPVRLPFLRLEHVVWSCNVQAQSLQWYLLGVVSCLHCQSTSFALHCLFGWSSVNSFFFRVSLTVSCCVVSYSTPPVVLGASGSIPLPAFVHAFSPSTYT